MIKADNKYKGYTLFNDVANAKLRAWNRSVTCIRTTKDGGYELTNKYLAVLPKEDRGAVMSCLRQMKSVGLSTVRNEVLKSI